MKKALLAVGILTAVVSTGCATRTGDYAANNINRAYKNTPSVTQSYKTNNKMASNYNYNKNHRVARGGKVNAVNGREYGPALTADYVPETGYTQGSNSNTSALTNSAGTVARGYTTDAMHTAPRAGANINRAANRANNRRAERSREATATLAKDGIPNMGG